MSAGLAPDTIHASAAFVDGTGVLVRGPSGSGKSALVLALILADSARNRLVADDRTVLRTEAGRLVASPPAALAGLIEIRGYGIVRLPHVAAQEIGLVVDLEEAGTVPRMPDRSESRASLLGVEIPRLALPIGHFDGATRVRGVLLAGCRTVNDG